MNDSSKIAVCFVADFKYLLKNFTRIYQELREIGKYEGEILIITNLLTPTFLIKKIRRRNKIAIYRYNNIKFDKITENSLKNLDANPNRHIEKNFQWNKLHLFNKKIKNWDYIFYFDINMSIHHDINPILKIKPKNKLFARADGYPQYIWKLSSQFDSSHNSFIELGKNFDLERTDYFQTGVMYFDTNIVDESTFTNIVSLVKEYPLSITNEQGVLNLYFLFINNKYVELENYINGKLSYFYWKLDKSEVIITKSLTQKNK